LTAVKFYSTGCPSGLSVAQSDRVTGKIPLKGDILASRKVIQKIIIMSALHKCTYTLVAECTTCTMHVAFSWFNSLFCLQRGILNTIEAMNFAPEIVYPLYLSAASDRYSI
jgi:proteasome component ECM29